MLVALEGEVTSVRANGWGVLVMVELLDHSATYSNLTRRTMEFMMSPHQQPSVGSKLKVTVEEAEAD